MKSNFDRPEFFAVHTGLSGYCARRKDSGQEPIEVTASSSGEFFGGYQYSTLNVGESSGQVERLS